MRRLLHRIGDAIVASDPGLGRLRMGATAATTMAAAIFVEFCFGSLVGAAGQQLAVFMLLGAIVAMMGSNALADHSIPANVRMAVWFPVAIGGGLALGTLVAPWHVLSLVVFVGVMFLSVWIRRFGFPFFFYGFMIWMGYFFADFLQVDIGQLPILVLAVVLATAVVLLLCCTVFLPDPRRTLARIFRSMSARTRVLARACAALIDAEPGSRAARRASAQVFDARARVNDASLMSDGWAAHQRALPVGWTSSRLRERLLDLQLGRDRITTAARALAGGDPDPELRELSARALSDFAAGAIGAARRDAAELTAAAQTAPEAARASLRQLARGIEMLAAVPPSPALPRAVQRNEREFVPAAALFQGQLPGSPSVASGIDARGGRWNPVSRASFATRQAVQVALAGGLAIVAGTAISGPRYYWAVIAAFVSFAGTGTRFETVRKSLLRVLGTLLGLFAGVLLAHLSEGRTIVSLGIIIAAAFCGNYLMRISYAYFIFFLTIMLSELYAILGEFTDALLELRLVETAVGAGIGIVVALVVAPVSTRDTILTEQSAVVLGIRNALESARARALDPAAVAAVDLDAALIAMDNEMRRLTLVGAPLTHYSAWENRPRAVRHRLTTVAAAVGAARAVAMAARSLQEPDQRLADDIGRVIAYIDEVRLGAAPEEDERLGDGDGSVARLQDLLAVLAPTASRVR